MSELPGLKATLKRGALVAAANWPLVAVQFIAESTLKLLLAVPVVGGIFLVVLLLGAERRRAPRRRPRHRRRGLPRDAPNSAALVAFFAAFAGRAARRLGAHLRRQGRDRRGARRRGGEGRTDRTTAAQRARRCGAPTSPTSSRFSTAASGCGAATSGSAAACSGRLRGDRGGLSRVRGRRLALAGNSGGPARLDRGRPLASSVLLVWITLVNLIYLLTQMVIAVEDVGVRQAACGGRSTSCAASLREVAGIFGVVLVLVALATVASILATAGLGLIAFVPLVGFAVLPLQVAALAAARLRLPVPGADRARRLPDAVPSLRGHRRGAPGSEAAAPGDNVPHDRLRRVSVALGRRDEGVGDPPDGHAARAGRDIISFAPGYPAPEMFPWAELQEITASLLSGSDGSRAAIRRRPAATGRCSRRSPTSWRRAARRPRIERLLVTTGSQQGLDLVARVLLDPDDVVLVELPTYTGAIIAFRNVQARMVGRAAGSGWLSTRRSGRRLGAARARRAGASAASTSFRISRTRPAC